MDDSNEEEEDEQADEEEDEGDEEERAVDEAREQRALEAENDSFAIEKVLDSRQRANRSAIKPSTMLLQHHADSDASSLTEDQPSPSLPLLSRQTEYLIQWHGDSHIYDTWHTEREIHQLCLHGRGLKKLSNFIAKERQRLVERDSVTIEEVEQMNVGLEMDRQEREEWVHVEKVIASEEANAWQVRQLQRLRRRRRKFRLPEEEAEADEAEETKMADVEQKEGEVTSGTVKSERAEDGSVKMEVDEQTVSRDVKVESTVKEEGTGVKKEEAVSDPVKAEAAAFADGQQAMEEEKLAEEAAEEAEEDDDADEDDEGDGSTVTRYLVKWRGLPHEECTWECADDIASYQSAIDAFLDLEQLTTAKQPPSVVSKKFRVLTEQPAYLSAGELRGYQMEGLNWLLHNWCRGINGILADEMGLGKTIQCIAFLAALFQERHQHGPFLVVVPLSTITAWQREFAKWAPSINVVLYVGNAASRDIIRRYEWFANTPQRGRGGRSTRYRFHVVLTTYEFVTKDKAHLNAVHWSYLMIDEAHRLKDNRSLLYTVLHSFTTDNRLLVTGTPLQNSLSELWCLLHFLHADKFPSLPDFEAQHGNVRSGELADVRSLHDVLQPHLLRRTKKDVLKSLPSKKEKILLVEMSALQRKYSRWIIARNYRDLNKGVKGKKASLSNIIVELKKCVNHPYLIKPPGQDTTTDEEREREAAELSTPELHLAAMIRHSGKLLLLDKLLRRLKETGHRVLIFSQMVKMLDILAEYLRLRGFVYQRLDGGMRSQERQYAMDHFNAPSSADFCFILSTKAGGLGINLATADTVIIFDSDWNPQNDLQAEARAHRIGQKNTVNIYRFVTRNTVEEDILQRAKQKMILDHLVIQRMDTSGRTVTAKGGLLSSNSAAMFDNRELAKILQFGAEDLFAENKEEDERREKTMEEMDIDEILSRADERTEGEGEGGGDKQEDQTEAFLSGFKVASFKSSEKDEDGDASNDEEDEQKEKKRAAEEGEGQVEFWQRIIPATLIPTDQLQDENAAAAPVLLAPRQRRVVQSYNENKLRERAEEERDSDLDEHSDDDRGKAGKRRRKKGRGAAADDDEGGDDGELSAKDVRALYRYMMYFGDDNRVLGELYASIWKNKPQDEEHWRKAKDMIQTIMAACEEAVRNPPPQQEEEPVHSKKGKKAGGEHEDDDEGGDAEGKKKARKKLSVELLPGVILHPTELLQRRKELQNLAQLVAAVGDPTKFRITRTSKPVPPVRWLNCIWKAKQDGMLMYGVFLHGMNAWDAIVDDPKLKLKECITIRRRKQKAEQTEQAKEERKDGEEEKEEKRDNGAMQDGDEQNGSVTAAVEPSSTHSATDSPSAAASPSVPASSASSAAVDEAADTAAATAAPLVPALSAPSTAADEYEEIRTVKNGQLASRAVALLKAMLLHDDKKKPAASKKSGRAAQQADDKDKDKKRSRQQQHTDEEADTGGKEHKKKKPKKDADKHSTADGDDAPHSMHDEPTAAATHGSSSKKKAGKADKERGDDAGGSAAKPPKPSKGAAKKADNKRIDDMFNRANKAAVADKPPKGNSTSPPATAHSTAQSPSPATHAAAASSPNRAAKEHKKHNGTSPLLVNKKLPPSAASSSSSTSSASVDDDDFHPALLEWCKAALSSRVKSELKALHHFAFSDGGFKAHQAEVKAVLLVIGRECERTVRMEKKGEAVRAELERHLWHTVSCFCKMTGPKLKKLYSVLLLQDKTAPPPAAAQSRGAGGVGQKSAAGEAASVDVKGAARPLPRQR